MKNPGRIWLLAVTCLVTACNDRGGGGGGSVPTGANVDPFGDYGLFLSILPPGQADCPTGGLVDPCPENFTDQEVMYENLVFTNPGQIGDAEHPLVPNFYKAEAFVAQEGAPADAGNSFVSTATVTDGTHTATISRDAYGVPYIYGATRADVMYGTGYATAEDRMFEIDAIRHVGRGRQSDFLGGAPPDAYDRELAIKAGYDEAELQAQGDQLAARFGVDGTQALVDVESYVAGINTYIGEVAGTQDQPVEYTALGLTMLPFTARDVVVTATLVQAIFAVGGGGEHNNVNLLRELLDQTGGNATAACQLWRDLRHADDPEKQSTASTRFETQSPPEIDESACPFSAEFATTYPGAVMFDQGSLETRDPLTVEECFAVANPITGDPECPDLGGDVVDDEVTAGAAAPLAFFHVEPRLAMNPWLGFETLLRPSAEAAPAVMVAEAAVPLRPVAPRRLPAEELRKAHTPTELAQAADSAFDTARGIRQALAMAESGLDFPAAMSNALLVAGGRTANGHPIAVFGPQTGYQAPNLLLELHQQGGDINSRGMTFAGLPYVVIGRGVDFAWSATSSSDDIIDIRVLELCNEDNSPPTRDSVRYVHNGTCKPMFERFDEWTAEYNAGAPPPGSSVAIGKKVTRRILRAPDYGPVFATATVNGEPVALAVQRSTYFGEVDSVAAFLRTSRNDVHNPETFYDAFYLLTGTFNWMYVDANNIAYFNSGLLPVRASGVHPDLPTWGNGDFDWAQTGTGQLNPSFDFANFLPLSAHPRQANPSSGYLISWNNAQAPGFWAADNKANWGAVHRSLLLERRLLASNNNNHTPESLVEIMADAATTDQRGQDVLPSIFEVLDSSATPALTAEQQAAVDLLKAWVANGTQGLGSHLRDRDGPGQDTSAIQYGDRAAAVLIDRWWDTMVEDVLPQVFGLENSPVGNVVPNPRHDNDMAHHLGSAFNQGYYPYVRRVMDMALGTSAHPYTQLKCAGTGVLADCRAALVSSLQKALDILGTDPAAWDGTDTGGDGDTATTIEQEDAIAFQAIGLATVPDMHWQNRPTYQQVVNPTAARQRR